MCVPKSANEIRKAHLCGRDHGPRRVARAQTLSRLMVSGGGGAISHPDLNHDWNCEELIRRAVEQWPGDPVVFSRSTTKDCTMYFSL